MPKSYSVGIVGESNYQAAIKGLRADERVWLVPEPGNPHDPRAIAVQDGDGQTIGYIPREHWLTAAIIDEGKESRAVVQSIEGGERGRPNLGVVLSVELGGEGATAGSPAPQQLPSDAKPVKSPKQTIGCAIVAVVALLALPSMCSDDPASPGEEAGASVEAVSPEDAEAVAAKKAQCEDLIAGLEGTGLIRQREASRITVEDANWAQVPYDQKISVLIGAFCAETGRQEPTGDERMSAYAFRSGDRLMTLTENGVF